VEDLAEVRADRTDVTYSAQQICQQNSGRDRSDYGAVCDKLCWLFGWSRYDRFLELAALPGLQLGGELILDELQEQAAARLQSQL
jgi:hypothetical protein